MSNQKKIFIWLIISIILCTIIHGAENNFTVMPNLIFYAFDYLDLDKSINGSAILEIGENNHISIVKSSNNRELDNKFLQSAQKWINSYEFVLIDERPIYLKLQRKDGRILQVIRIPTKDAEIPNYNNIKGDYKVFCLKDSREEINLKMVYLVDKGEIEISSLPDYFSTMIIGYDIDGTFDFYNDILYNIRLYQYKKYQASDINYALKKFIDDISNMLIKLYGKSTIKYKYPSIFDFNEGYQIIISKWILPKKTITISIRQSNFYFNPEINITDNEISKKIKEEEINKIKQAEEQSLKDF